MAEGLSRIFSPVRRGRP